MRDARERVRDILEAIAAIERHAQAEKESFEWDAATRDVPALRPALERLLAEAERRMR